MDEESTTGDIAREDVIDALADPENEDALMILTEFYYQENGQDAAFEEKIENALECAKLLFDERRYGDVGIWLDEIGTEFSDQYGPDSDEYVAFTENEDLEALRMEATERAMNQEEESDDEYDDDDE